MCMYDMTDISYRCVFQLLPLGQGLVYLANTKFRKASNINHIPLLGSKQKYFYILYISIIK